MIGGKRAPVDAPTTTYVEQSNPDYKDNPFIEALPGNMDDNTVVKAMQNYIHVTDAERAFARHERMHYLGRLKNFMQPLDIHIDLFHRMSVAIKQGYVRRNPLRSGFVTGLSDGVSAMHAAAGGITGRQRTGPGSSITLIGPTGVGKTYAVDAVLRCYPQTIVHTGLKGTLGTVQQVVWLKLSVPPDGSIPALCLSFFEAIDQVLGTEYTLQPSIRNGSADKLMILMGRFAYLHGLGMLVIDELHHLNAARSGGDVKMMNFFKLLRDAMQVPLMAIGTLDALPFLSGGMEVARRSSGFGRMEPLRDDEQFRLFCESLFDVQYLRNPVRLPDETATLLFHQSQGIVDVAVQVFKLAQDRALATGQETLTHDLLRFVYERDLRMLHPFLEEMRRGRQPVSRAYDNAIADGKRKAFPPLPATAHAGPLLPAPAAGAEPGGVARKSRRKSGLETSRCVLVRTVDKGRADDVSPYDALAKAGYIRNLGKQVLEG